MSSNTVDIHTRLVERCKRQDRQAQKELYDLYHVQMFHVALRILNSKEEAEDVLQEAFVDMFKKIHTFRGDSTFGAWFKRIVTNKSINELKKKKYPTSDVEELPEITEAEEEAYSVEYTVDQIKSAMSELKPGFRTVFSLYMFESYTHQDIAEEMGISVGTSKSQLSRAKEKVRNWLLTNRRVS